MATRAARPLLLVLFTTILLAGVVALLGNPAPGAGAAAVEFRDGDGNVISGPVRVLCFRDTSGPPFADLLIEVDTGMPAPQTPLPDGCDFLAALRPLLTQPSGKRAAPAYTIYSTSWQPADPAPPPAPAGGIIVLDEAQPLTLFHLVVSLAWEPAAGSALLRAADLLPALRQTAAALYDWTEGRMAIGPVTVHTGGKEWSAADIRLLPANDYRPSAFPGGIVPAPVTYSTAFTEVTYSSAPIYAGRLWDGEVAFRGPWTAPNGYLTLGHEWAHYALFLYDEYQQHDDDSRYCICDDLPTTAGCGYDGLDASVMAYFYLDQKGGFTGSEFWHPDTHFDAGAFCYQTWQATVHGASDWEALEAWHQIQGLPAPFAPLDNPTVAELTPGPPLGLAAHLFGREPGQHVWLPVLRTAGTAGPGPQEPTIAVEVDATPTLTQPLPAQVYLLKDDGGGAPILPQGGVHGTFSAEQMGELTLLDVEAGDTLRIFTDRYSAGGDGVRYDLAGEAPFDEIPAAALLVENSWSYTLTHAFLVEDGRPLSLTLSLRDEANVLGAPAAQICDLDNATPCWDMQLNLRASGWWEATINSEAPEGLPRYLLARVYDAGDPGNVHKEVVQWIQMAGGVGPGHKDGMAPLLDGLATVNAAGPLNSGDCNAVSYSPATDAAARIAPLGRYRIVELPLDLFVHVTDDLCPPVDPGSDLPLPDSETIYLTLGYSQATVDRLGANEDELLILHYDRDTGWVEVDTFSRDQNLNWVMAPIVEDGIYAIGYQFVP